MHCKYIYTPTPALSQRMRYLATCPKLIKQPISDHLSPCSTNQLCFPLWFSFFLFFLFYSLYIIYSSLSLMKNKLSLNALCLLPNLFSFLWTSPNFLRIVFASHFFAHCNLVFLHHSTKNCSWWIVHAIPKLL